MRAPGDFVLYGFFLFCFPITITVHYVCILLLFWHVYAHDNHNNSNNQWPSRSGPCESFISGHLVAVLLGLGPVRCCKEMSRGHLKKQQQQQQGMCRWICGVLLERGWLVVVDGRTLHLRWQTLYGPIICILMMINTIHRGVLHNPVRPECCCFAVAMS